MEGFKARVSDIIRDRFKGHDEMVEAIVDLVRGEIGEQIIKTTDYKTVPYDPTAIDAYADGWNACRAEMLKRVGGV